MQNEIIESKIYIIRGQKVMLDVDLAVLYEVETRILNQSVKRNKDRFPDDFMFGLDKKDLKNLRSQIVISSLVDEDKDDLRSQIVTSNLKSQIVTSSYGGRRYSVFAFTEQGIAMLSSVLRSQRAIQVNIQIMRTFTRMRQMLINHNELREKIEELESKYDENFRVVFEAIERLLVEDEKPQVEIGFKA